MPFPPMTTTQQFTITPQFLNHQGKPAPVDGVPTYASSNEATATVVPAADGLTALVVAQGVGGYEISVSADADLGSGVRTLVGKDDGEVTLGEAVSVGFAVGPIEEQP